MRLVSFSVLLLLLLLLLVAVPTSEAASDPRPCRAALPRGPSVPEPVVLRNSCGLFRLDRDGRVSRLPPRWLALQNIATRRYGADLRLIRTRPGDIILRREGRLVWRSSHLYRNDGGSVAFGPHALAFAAYRRGIFLTDLRSPERLVVPGRGLYPVGFFAGGSLLVVGDGHVRVVSSQGSVTQRIRYRTRNGYAFDERTESLFVVTPERLLARVDRSGVRVVRPVRGLDGWLSTVGRYLTYSDFAHRGGSDQIRFAVLRRDGRLVSRWSWRSPKGAGIDYGPVASEDARAFVFRTVTRPRGDVVVYVLRAGEKRARPVFRHRGRQLGCGVGASLQWRGRFLLYSASDGPSTIVDVRDATRADLTRIGSKLPSRAPGERPTASWFQG